MKAGLAAVVGAVLVPGPGLALAASAVGVPPGPAAGAIAPLDPGAPAAVAAPDPSPSAVAATAVAYALGQIGTPYVWGGEAPGAGFDCSGLVQAAYAAAGVHLPRVAQSQFDVGPEVPPGVPLVGGDLVFFGAGPAAVSHVGIYLGGSGGRTLMVDAPHSGADVRVETFPAVAGASWGSDVYVGATRPR